MIKAKIIKLLKADPTLVGLVPGGFWADIGPPNPTFPLVLVVGVLPGADDPTHDGKRLTRYRLQVKAVTEAPSPASAVPIATRIDQVLSGAKGDGILSVLRTSPVDYPEVDPEQKSRRFNHLGGIYSILASEGGS
jgi:hypothetical protein